MIVVIICCVLSAGIGYFIGSILSAVDKKYYKISTLEENIEKETQVALEHREWEKRNGQ